MADRGRSRHPGQGFTLVEVLLAMVILSIGLLGLLLLQVMAIRGARGGRALNTGLLVGESILDRIELEGRLSWLNAADPPSGTVQALSTLQFVNRDKLDQDLPFNAKGTVPNPNAPDPADRLTFYTVNMVRTPVSTVAAGHLSDFIVTVTFPDLSQPSSAGVASATRYRTLNLTRRVLHG